MKIILHKYLKVQYHFIRTFCSVVNTEDTVNIRLKKNFKSRTQKVASYFLNHQALNMVKDLIPEQYFILKKSGSVGHLYLCDHLVAKDVVQNIVPFLRNKRNQIICESNVGLGLITKELLKLNINHLRLYEKCSDFREKLQDFEKIFPEKIELFNKDIFQTDKLFYLDKCDQTNRMEDILKGIPTRKWHEEPVITIIGPMVNLKFVYHLIKMIVLQDGIAAYGRPHIFALMKPADFFKMTAIPKVDLQSYSALSVLCHTFLNCTVLNKYPRKSFLPWETKLKLTPYTRRYKILDNEYMYLVRIKFKPTLPVESKYLLDLFCFITQGFFRGSRKVIPTIEKWLPGIGADLICFEGNDPNKKDFINIDIFTQFRDLYPIQILKVFEKLLNHPQYSKSAFMGLIEFQMQLYTGTNRDSTTNSSLQLYPGTKSDSTSDLINQDTIDNIQDNIDS